MLWTNEFNLSVSGQYTKIDLCEFYGISRPMGDKWIGRYRRLGLEGLKELSRAAKHHPNAMGLPDLLKWFCTTLDV